MKEKIADRLSRYIVQKEVDTSREAEKSCVMTCPDISNKARKLKHHRLALQKAQLNTDNCAEESMHTNISRESNKMRRCYVVVLRWRYRR